MKIPLSKGYFAIIDYDDFFKLCYYSWHVIQGRNTNYAARCMPKSVKRLKIRMHRELLGAKTNDGLIIDHINGNGLDNRKSNLRVVNHSQNGMNRPANKTSVSKYKGVSWSKTSKIWVAQIVVNRKVVYLGRFEEEIEAAQVYNAAAEKYHGKFAFVNNVTIGEGP